MRNSKLELNLEIGRYNGTMSMDLSVNDLEVLNYSHFHENNIKLSINLCMPATVTILLGNKNMEQDTLVDDQGRIVKDKFIHLKQAFLGGIEIDSIILQQICEYHYHGAIHHNCYWGFPGKVIMKFDQPTGLRWHLHHLK